MRCWAQGVMYGIVYQVEILDGSGGKMTICLRASRVEVCVCLCESGDIGWVCDNQCIGNMWALGDWRHIARGLCNLGFIG